MRGLVPVVAQWSPVSQDRRPGLAARSCIDTWLDKDEHSSEQTNGGDFHAFGAAPLGTTELKGE